MSNVTNVKAISVSDEVSASATFIAVAARPTATFTLANTSFASGGGRILTATTAGTGDSGKTVTIVGTDIAGTALTEIITLPGSATTTAGTMYFLTVTSATVSAQPAANVSLGMSTGAAQSIFNGRTRVRGLQMASGASAGDVTFENGPPAGAVSSGNTVLVVRTPGTGNAAVEPYIPDNGVLCASGAYIYYTVGEMNQVSVFYDG